MRGRGMRRRAFLKGTGAAIISLPLLDAAWPSKARAQVAPAPLRTCLCLYPYGSVRDTLAATADGSGYAFPGPYAEYLDPHRAEITWINDLTNYWGNSNGDGLGDHARGQGTYLTQSRLLKEGLRAGKSADRYIRDVLVGKTSVASLNVSGPGATGGDSGYSAEYRKISWVDATTPDTPISQPHLAFDELFANFDPNAAPPPSETLIRNRLKKSVLDGAVQDANRLGQRLGTADRVKLDQYLTSIREVEEEIRVLIENEGPPEVPVNTCDPGARPEEQLDFDTRTRLMFEIIRLGFQCDVTRLATFFMGSASFAFWGVSGEHHAISHHADDPSYPARLVDINRYYASRFGEFLEKLKNTPDAGGTRLIDNCIVTLGSDMRDGNRHDDVGMSVAVAGRAAGAFTPGRLITGVQPLSNVWLTIMKANGVQASSFGAGEASSTGTIAL